MADNRESSPNPLPCGCRAMMHLDPTGTGTSIYVRQCALHEAAEDLLKALERIVKIRQPCPSPSADAVASGDEPEHIPECCRWCKARAAVAKARPPKAERAGELDQNTIHIE